MHFVKCQELTLRASHPFSSYGPRGHSVAINQGTADTQPPSATRDEIKKRDAAQRGGDAAFQHVLGFNAVCARVLISRIKSLKVQFLFIGMKQLNGPVMPGLTFSDENY